MAKKSAAATQPVKTSKAAPKSVVRPTSAKKKAVVPVLETGKYYLLEKGKEKIIGKCVGVIDDSTVELRALVNGDLSNVRNFDVTGVTATKEVNKHVAYNLSVDADHYGG